MHHTSDAPGASTRAPSDDLTEPIPDRFEISFYDAPARTTVTPTPATVTWAELVDLCSHHERRLTKNGRGWSGAKLKPGTTRKNENVEAVSVFLGDVDGIATDRYAELGERLMEAGLAFLVYSTFKSDEVELRLRFGIPLATPITDADWSAAYESIDAYLFDGLLDPNAKDISRMSYMPAAKPDAVTLAEHHDGRALDWRKLPPAPARPAGSTNGTSRGEDVGIGRATLEFIAMGAPIGHQRRAALAATRSLLADGKSVEDTAALVWKGMQASPVGDAGDPWSYDDALHFAKDLAARKPTKLEQGPTLTLDDEDGTGYFGPGERANGATDDVDDDDDWQFSAAETLAEMKNGHVAGEPVTNGTAHQDEAGASPKARPSIHVSGEDPRVVAQLAIKALRVANTPKPRLFVRGGQLARVLHDEDGRPVIQTLTKDGLLHELTDAATFERYDARSKKWKVGGPPDEVVRYVGAHGEWPLPPLVGITQAPVIRPDGTIVTEPGYDPVTRLVYTPADGLNVPAIPEAPTDDQVRGAVSMLDELLDDFAFDGQHSAANARGLLVTMIVRPAIVGPTPLAVINKNTPGAGATLLTEVQGIVAHGRAPGLTAVPTEDVELEKRITTLLRDGEPFNVFDNVDHPLEHGSLALVLTATEWAGRILGRSETARYPNRAVWSANGNNLVLRGDIARRSYQIRMVAEDAQPWRLDAEGATRYRHPRLAEWAAAHRGELLAAVLTLARNWYAKGCPEPATPRLGKFEDWCRVVGGILEAAGVEGFLGNLDELYSNVDAEAGEWEAFLAAWFDAYGNAERSPAEIKTSLQTNTQPAMVEALPGDLADALNDQRTSFERKLGRALAKRADRRYGDRGLHLVRRGSTGRPKWRVEERKPGVTGVTGVSGQRNTGTVKGESVDSSIERSGENSQNSRNSRTDDICAECGRVLGGDELPCANCVEERP